MREAAAEQRQAAAEEAASRACAEATGGAQPWKKFVYVEPPKRVKEILEEELYFRRDECQIKQPAAARCDGKTKVAPFAERGASRADAGRDRTGGKGGATWSGAEPEPGRAAMRGGWRRTLPWAGAERRPRTLAGAEAERRRQQQQQHAHALACAAAMPPERAPRSLPRWRRRVAAAGLACSALALCACLRDLPAPPRPGARTVLLWWEPFGRSRRLPDCALRFNVSGCRLSAERRRYAEAAAVLFHHRDLVRHGRAQLPPGAPQRPSGQRWVWMNFESPSHSPGLRGWGGLFNWTMSYRLDSDVFVPYGALRAARAPGRLVLPRKTKLVAWVISHWNEEHARVRYYRQLQKYLPVDVYGAQGLALKEGGVVRTVSEYKFYLAFENSQHTDYITEKLWRNAFKAGAVPIVLGPRRANYELFVPPNSFIHVDDFSSPRKLAVYLKFLDRNPRSYRRYFAWREKYDVHVASFWDEHYCRACEVLQAAGDDQVKSVQNLAGWFES